jgi:hypothetical protein
MNDLVSVNAPEKAAKLFSAQNQPDNRHFRSEKLVTLHEKVAVLASAHRKQNVLVNSRVQAVH